MTTFRRPDPAPLPPDGLARVVRAGRRRRAVWGASTGAVAAVALVLAAVTFAPRGNQSLQPVAPGPGTQSPTPVPSPSPERTPPSPAATTRPQPTEVPASRAPSKPSPPSRAPEPTRSPDPPDRVYPHHTDVRTGDRATGFPPEAERGWHVAAEITPSYGEASDERPETVYEIELSMCYKGAPGETATLQYGTPQEVDFAVVNADGREVWRWSRDSGWPQVVHDRTVESYSCAWWATDWYGVGDDGRVLPAGKYAVRLFSNASGWRDRPVAEMHLALGYR